MKNQEAVYTGVSTKDVLHFMFDLVRRAELTYAEIRKPKEAMPDEVRVVLAGGLVLALASLDEAVRLLSVIEPLAGFDEIRNASSGDLEHWIGFRHDVAHPVDKMFREPMAKAHDPKLIDQRADVFVSLLQYDPKIDTLSTGQYHHLMLREALEQARSFLKRVGNAWLTAMAAEKITTPPEFANIPGQMLVRGYLELRDAQTLALNFGNEHPLVQLRPR